MMIIARPAPSIMALKGLFHKSPLPIDLQWEQVGRMSRNAKVGTTIETLQEVMFFDTDCGGVVHNIAYLRMIEVCRTKLAEEIGMDLQSMAHTQRFPVVTRTEIDYRRPAKLGDQLLLRGWISEWRRVRFCCNFEIRRQSDNDLIAESKQHLALIQMPEGKPISLAEGIPDPAR